MYFNITVGKDNLYVNESVEYYQYGFRREKLIVDHIFALRQIMAKHCKFNKELRLMFIDYKTCDSIDKKELSKTLKVLGVPKKYTHWIKECNNKTAENISCKVY